MSILRLLVILLLLPTVLVGCPRSGGGGGGGADDDDSATDDDDDDDSATDDDDAVDDDDAADDDDSGGGQWAGTWTGSTEGTLYKTIEGSGSATVTVDGNDRASGTITCVYGSEYDCELTFNDIELGEGGQYNLSCIEAEVGLMVMDTGEGVLGIAYSVLKDVGFQGDCRARLERR